MCIYIYVYFYDDDDDDDDEDDIYINIYIHVTCMYVYIYIYTYICSDLRYRTHDESLRLRAVRSVSLKDCKAASVKPAELAIHPLHMDTVSLVD